MSFDFTESATIELPSVKEQFSYFKESFDHKSSNKLVVELAAIHAGLTSNYNHYSAEMLEAAQHTWVNPYPRPVIMNHDEFSEPIGRVMSAKMDVEADGTKYVRLQVAIKDPEAIEKVLDQRYLTGSIGGSAGSARCSICDVDWAAAEMGSGLPCRHKRGSVYEGKLAYFELSNLEFREYSFVNVPADKTSTIRAINQGGASEDADAWTHTVNMYAMDMDRPSIIEMSESKSGTNILTRMKKKEAQATYMNLKGTFLTVSAFDYQENDNEIGDFVNSDNTIYNSPDTENVRASSSQSDEDFLKENDMANPAEENEVTPEDDDILSVTEKLTAELADAEADEETPEEDEEDEETDSPEESSDEVSDTETDPEESANSQTPEDEAAEDGQLDNESPEEDEEDVEQAENQAEEASDDASPEGQEDDDPTDSPDPTRESEELAELTSQNEALRTENARLRAALHNTLVERVVETKIALGEEDASNRVELVAEHKTRTASSLADTLRDLQRKPRKTFVITPTEATDLTIKPTSLAVSNEEKVETEGEVVEEKKPEISVSKLQENLFTGLLSGRIRYSANDRR